MSSDAVKIARYNRQAAQLAALERVLYNPAVEFIGGMYAIENLFPEASRKQIVKTTSGTSPLNPLRFLWEIFGSKETTTTTEIVNESTEEHWAKNALMWIIIAQQVAPVIPGVVQAGGSAISGVASLARVAK